MNGRKAVVVFSGGQDSTTCLYWAIRRFGREGVLSLTFNYQQRHAIEIECAARIASFAGIENVVLPVDTFGAIGGNSLTDTAVDIGNNLKDELPNTFVPGRNLIFLTFAAAFAMQRAIPHVVTGVAQTDYSGYPDCREETIRSLEATLRLGMEYPIEIHTPLMHLSKKQTIELASDLGAMDAMAMTMTCYNGEQPPCGRCPACRLRAKGFAEAGIADPLVTP